MRRRFAEHHGVGSSLPKLQVSRRSALRFAAACLVGSGAIAPVAEIFAATPPKQEAEAGELFDALQAGSVEAKVVARDPHHVRVFLKNTSKQPISVRLPEVLAARPILAQQNFFNPQQGGNGFAGFGNSSSSTQQAPQAVAGPMGSANGNRGGTIFSIPPESVREVKIDSVCLEHGKPDPRSAVPYELVKLDEVCKEPAVEALLTRYGQGGIDRDIVQAAAWNLANGLAWTELENMTEPVALNAVKPVYTSQQLRSARQLTDEAKKFVAAKKRPEGATAATKAASQDPESRSEVKAIKVPKL